MKFTHVKRLMTPIELSEWKVARIDELSPTRIAPLVLDSANGGFNMLARLVDEWQSGVNRFDKAGEALFGIYRQTADLVAIGGLNRNPYSEEPDAGRVRRVYVHGSLRRKGLGGMAVSAIIVEAEQEGYRSLVLRAPESAFAFYESLRFERIIGVETITHRLPLSSM